MSADGFTEEQLMSYADGEASERDAAAIGVAAAMDPALRRKIESYRESRRLARHAMPLEPVSSVLEERVRAMAQRSRSEGDRAFPATATSKTPLPANDNSGRWWRMPLAASLLFGFGLGSGMFLGRNLAVEGEAVSVAGHLNDELRRALGKVPTGEETVTSAGKFRAIASFRVKDGRLCREFEKTSRSGLAIVGVACNLEGQWSVETILASTQSEGGYAPASSLEAIDAYLASVGAGEILSPSDEKSALEALTSR
jgi:anti-sigma factor RsiW